MNVDTPESQLFCESDVPFDAERIGAAAIYCSDGRYGDQIDDLLHHALALPAYDRLAVPGGSACLAGHPNCFFEEQAMLRQIQFLAQTHKLSRIVLIAHQDCAFYLEQLHVSPDLLRSQQLDDLAKVARRIRKLARKLPVDAFFASPVEGKIRFEKVEL
jgi:hypothetical protein